MRARLVFSVLAASWFALAAALVTTPSAQAAECDAGKTVRIPHMTSFSGAAADWGELMFKGAVIGAEMINDRGGLHGRCLEFYRADAPYDDKPASVTMFKKLARNPNIPLVFDGGAGTVIFATHDLATQHKVPYYAFSSGGNWPGRVEAVDLPAASQGGRGGAHSRAVAQEEVQHQESGDDLVGR